MADVKGVQLQDAGYTPSRATMQTIKSGIASTNEGLKNTKLLITIISLVIVALLGANFGLTLAASNLSWNKHESDGKLVSSDGKTMQTGIAVVEGTITAETPRAALEEITTVKVTVGVSPVTLKVHGFYSPVTYGCGHDKSGLTDICNPTEVVFLTNEGKVSIDKAGKATLDLVENSPLHALKAAGEKELEKANALKAQRHLLAVGANTRPACWPGAQCKDGMGCEPCFGAGGVTGGTGGTIRTKDGKILML